MSEFTTTAEVLRHLITREGVPGGIPAMTPMRAFRLAISKSGQMIAAARLKLGSFDDQRITLAEFTPDLARETLLIGLKHPSGQPGMIVLGSGLVQAIGGVRTAQVLPRQIAPDHVPTRIDAVVCAPFLAALLAAFADTAAGLDIAPVFAGYKLGDFVSDRDAFFLSLADVPYRQIRVMVSYGLDNESAPLTLLVPAKAMAVADHPALGTSDEDWQRRLVDNVMKAEGALQTRLPPLRVTLDKLRGLAVGLEIPLPAEALNSVIVQTLDGKTIGQGRLGQLAGNRAVRLLSVRE